MITLQDFGFQKSNLSAKKIDFLHMDIDQFRTFLNQKDFRNSYPAQKRLWEIDPEFKNFER